MLQKRNLEVEDYEILIQVMKSIVLEGLMLKKIIFCIGFIIALIQWPLFAYADHSLDHYYLDDFTSFYGPTLGKINAESVDVHGNQTAAEPITFDNEITAAYLTDIEKGIGIGPDIRFYYNPSDLSPQKFTLNDCGIKGFYKKTVDENGLRVFTSLELLLPTSDASRNRNMNWGLKSIPYFWYNLPNSNFKVGSWTEFKFYDGVTSGRRWKFYLDPYISYDVSERFSWQLGYEMDYGNFVGLSGFRTVERDIQPGFAWNITRSLFVNPYLQIFPFDTISWKTTAISLYVGIRVL